MSFVVAALGGRPAPMPKGSKYHYSRSLGAWAPKVYTILLLGPFGSMPLFYACLGYFRIPGDAKVVMQVEFTVTFWQTEVISPEKWLEDLWEQTQRLEPSSHARLC